MPWARKDFVPTSGFDAEEKYVFPPRQILTLRSGAISPAPMAQGRGQTAYPVDPVYPVKILYCAPEAHLLKKRIRLGLKPQAENSEAEI